MTIAGCSGRWNPHTDARSHERIIGDKELGDPAFPLRSATAAGQRLSCDIRLRCGQRGFRHGLEGRKERGDLRAAFIAGWHPTLVDMPVMARHQDRGALRLDHRHDQALCRRRAVI